MRTVRNRLNVKKRGGIAEVAKCVRALQTKCDYSFDLFHTELSIKFWLFLQKNELFFVWHVRKLGESYPGGKYSLLGPTVVFVDSKSEKRVSVSLLPMTSHTHRPRMTGRGGYFHVRGWHMPRLPLTAHIGLRRGDYEVRFKCGMQIVKGLRRYIPDYSHHTSEIEKVLGNISLHKDFLKPEPRPINEFHYIISESVERKRSLPTLDSKIPPNPLNPEYYFDRHLIEPARRIIHEGDRAFYPFQTQVRSSLRWTPFVQNERIFAGYCGSLALAFRLTQKAEYYRAARYAYEVLNRNIWRTKWGWAIGLETFREGENLLEFGICAQNIFEFYGITRERRLLEKVHLVLHSWPFNRRYHLPFIEVDRDGKEIHPSYPFNMVAVGCVAMWQVGEVFEDAFLRKRVRETIHNFLLPMMEEDGHWQYALHYEEKKKHPEPRGYHYDLLTKMNLSRLLEYEEWRRDERFKEAMVKGIEFSLRNDATRDSQQLRWSDLYTSGQGPHFAINHAGLAVGCLAPLAKYVDRKYLEPLEKTLHFLYAEGGRDDLSARVDWKSDWMHYHVFLPLLKMREYGFNMSGNDLKTLKAALPEF